MNRIAFAFDLHNTILHSNESWIESFIENSNESFRSYITQAIYKKTSRKLIAKTIEINYDSVYMSYHKRCVPDEKMIMLLKHLKRLFPIYLISSAKSDKVYDDLLPWNGDKYFDCIFTKDNFNKSVPNDWQNLILNQELDTLIYVGNDIEEDIQISSNIIPLITGTFLKKLDQLDLLVKR